MAQDDVTTHTIGEMDIREQQRTFNGFLRFCVWTTVVTAVVLIFLALANA
ncbi:MAG: aa3-type cytochrome c oxidase subunit IV [Paracoccus sp. (in: a-proteobacteria)]|nr:aa3-type cytochrome c oxidase subunit IV [Paracoccus sp. (in: a-proteobacteria)]MDO5632486.1 aa3-type cytochrome c oxidase subunit IV [Paracoccus sp. (in: a-proteobacteria)]